MKIPRLQSLATKFRKPLSTLCVLAATAGLSVAAQAGNFTGLYIFGDSLSDTGNLQAMTTQLYLGGQFPSPYPTYPGSPYFDGRFSNGPLWVEHLAKQMGLAEENTAPGFCLVPGPTSDSCLFPERPANGRNFAVAGARTGTTGFFEPLQLHIPTGVQTQVGQFLAEKGGIAPNAGTLYVMLAGGNNIRDAALQPTKALQDAVTINAARAYRDAIASLVDGGAKTILVGNVNDIGKTPEAVLERHNFAAATAASRLFNATLTPLLDQLEAAKGVRFIRLDLFGLFNAVYDDTTRQGGHIYGLTNATTPCFAGFAGWEGADCSVSIFSDDLHPTTAVHRILAQAAAACHVSASSFLGGLPESGSQALGRFCTRKQ